MVCSTNTLFFSKSLESPHLRPDPNWPPADASKARRSLSSSTPPRWFPPGIKAEVDDYLTVVMPRGRSG